MGSDFVTAELDSLLAQLTTDEARRLTTGVGWWRTAGIDRLGIPALKVSDGPNGVKGERTYYGSKALSLPCESALGSTWDVELIQELGQKIMATEARLCAVSVLLAPTVNIHRSPLCGRSFELFSEDPHLSGTIAAAYVNSIQKEGIACSIKHFVCNEQENNRHGSDSIVTPRALREIYLMPFMIAERDARPWSYMTAYNKLNGIHCSENYWLLNTLLREEWGSKAMVLSDWYGVYSLVRSYKAGMDLEMPGEHGLRDAKSVDRRILAQKLTVDDIKICSKRVLGLAKHLAKTCKDVVLGHGKEREPQATVEQRALLRRAAAQSIVLLRNEGNILPLDVTKIKKVTVIGPNAKQRLITGGGSNEVTPIFVVSPLEGIEQAFGKDNVTFVEGCRSARHADRLNYDLITPDGEDGWRLEFYNHDAVDQNLPLFDEEPVLVVPALAQTQIKIFAMQVLGLTEQFSVKFKAFLKPQDFSGEWDFSLIVVGRAKLWIDGQLVVDLWDGQKMGEMFGYQATEEVSGRFYVEQGKTYELEVLYNNISPLRGYAPAISRAIRLGGWPVVNEDEDLKAAEKAAAEADVAIVVVGLNQDWESEGHDRKTMDLPARSNELITRVSRANPRTIIVNQSGSAVTMPWADQVPAILQTWYAGNSAGDALADVLTGLVNPSAKLSLTFPRRVEDIPSHGHFGSKLGPVRYAEDLWVGYKHYIDRRISPLWPFGFGLSYTTFEYSDLEVSTATVSARNAKDVRVELSVKITNTGTRVGSEVVQVYISPPAHELLEPSPSQVLKGFARVKDLQPGTSGVARVVLDKYAFSFWEENKDAWLVAKGVYRVLVAASSVDVKLKMDVMVEKDVYWTGL